MRGHRRFWLVVSAVVSAAALAVPAASAARPGGLGLLPSCGATSHPFTNWGDHGSYCAFPNLGFESGANVVDADGHASVVSANEPWHVSGPGTHALRLGPGATALSSPLPVSLLDPWIRFFARSRGADGPLHVQVLFRGLTRKPDRRAQLRQPVAGRLHRAGSPRRTCSRRSRCLC